MKKQKFFRFFGLLLSFILFVGASIPVKATTRTENKPNTEPVTTLVGKKEMSENAAEAYYELAAYMREQYDIIIQIRDCSTCTEYYGWLDDQYIFDFPKVPLWVEEKEKNSQLDVPKIPWWIDDENTNTALDLYVIVGNEVLNSGQIKNKRYILKPLHESLTRFGFILRYPEGKEDVTGHKYDPLHIRFVGSKETADLITQKGTLEETFNVN